MKIFKAFIVGTVMFCAVVAVSCNKKKTENKDYGQIRNEVADSLASENILPSEEYRDSVSYLLGVNHGMLVLNNNFFDAAEDMNVESFMKGYQDVMAAGSPKGSRTSRDTVWVSKFDINPYEINRIFNEYLTARRTYLAELNRIAGERFLEQNALNEGVQKTDSGLQYIIHEEGTGAKVAAEDTVIVNYKGRLLDGTQFDANDSTKFVANRLMKGWTEGLSYLNKGAKATLYIPGGLAYGEFPPQGSGIEPSSTLVFEIEILDVKKR